MSKRTTKSQASSSRAATGAFPSGFGTPSASAFGATSSPLSYVTEPPDLSSISDPNVVVHFKNLSKKDSTTKAKALEEIQAYISSLSEPVEDGVLEAWIKLFPRTSIDSSRRVRQLSYTLHGQISASAGKRIARHMPKAIGAWLCGLYDNDKGVVKAAQDALQQVFSTPEKLQSVRRAYQQPIMAYCRDAIDKETAQTLSDERTVSPDDAEAKYSRVISACITVIGSLLNELKSEDLVKQQSEYEVLFSDDRFWAFAVYGDAAVRRAVHRFLRTCLVKQPDTPARNLKAISKVYLANGLNSEQIGSAYDYAHTLGRLTAAHASVWTDHYSSKTAVTRRLRQFLKRGSQSGPREFWGEVTALFKHIPKEVLPTSAADAVELLSAVQGGIISKDEPRANLGSAFGAYIDIGTLICQPLSEEDQAKVLQEMVLPIISQYIRPTPEDAQWTIPPPSTTTVVAKALMAGRMPRILETEWPRYAEKLVEDIKTSAPEQSKDYDKSQKAVIQQANKFATLQAQGIRNGAAEALRAAFIKATAETVSESLNVMKTRNAKPYGAAGAVAELLRLCRDLVVADKNTVALLDSFLEESIPLLFQSPSCSQLADILYSLDNAPRFHDAWAATLRNVLNTPDSPAKVTALEHLLASPRIPSTFNMASSDPELQRYVRQKIGAALEGASDWESFEHILRFSSKIMAKDTTEEILSSMTEALSINDRTPHALQGLQHVTRKSPALVRTFVPTPKGSDLIRRLLFLSESGDDRVARDASAVNSSVQAILAQDANGNASKQSMYEVVQNGLKEVSHMSLTVETLVELAKKLWDSESSKEDSTSGILPDLNDWEVSLNPFLNIAPKPSISITNPLGGAVYVVEPSSSQAVLSAHFPRDSEGYSAAFRNAFYFVALIRETDVLTHTSTDTRKKLLHLIALSVQLADDNLGLAGSNNLWAEYNPEVESDAIAFISDAQQFIKHQLKEISSSWTDITPDSSGSPLIKWATESLQHGTDGFAAPAYYKARTYSVLTADLVELHGWSSKATPEAQTVVRGLRKDSNLLFAVAFLNAFKEPLAATKSCERLCNELVADLTGLNLDSSVGQALRQLILLNTILYGQEDVAQAIAKQRVIFLVKHVVPWLEDSDVALPVKAEVCRALAILLPLMDDIYGEHWAEILGALTTSWLETTQLGDNESGLDSPIPFIHASLKLYASLQTSTRGEEPNDDLVDALKDAEADVAKGLTNLLKHSQHFPDEFHQPLKIVNELLARQISKIPLKYLESSEELFPLLYVESQPVQQTAFDILHKQIPAAQEQISIDAALDKKTARLPEELLSLILEAPTVNSLADASFERSIPLPLRGYLFSWLLVFDHLQHASYKVKTDYIEHIKEGEYLPGLLEFMFDFLGHARGKPVDVSKLDVTSYTPDIESPERDTQWLLTHIYYLCLTYIPSLAKSWWIDCKSRQKVIAVETWTEKYISPSVISTALTAVSEWSTNQSTTDDTEPLTIKVSQRAREVTASYEIDEQTLTIRISLPPEYPLKQASVEGLNRVAVDEKKWQSWLRTSQGVITFSNGNLIDGLTTFKRNVVGALKGQTECAICYSIVGPEKTLPSKRCNTCKNLFHGGCLYKWFRTSNSSSCPLCRNAFNYG